MNLTRPQHTDRHVLMGNPRIFQSPIAEDARRLGGEIEELAELSCPPAVASAPSRDAMMYLPHLDG